MADSDTDLHPPSERERLLTLIQKHDLRFGMTFLDGTYIGARQKLEVGAYRQHHKEAVQGIARNPAGVAALGGLAAPETPR